MAYTKVKKMPLLHGYIMPNRCEVVLTNGIEQKILRSKTAAARWLRCSNDRMNQMVARGETFRGWRVASTQWIASRIGLLKGLTRSQARASRIVRQPKHDAPLEGHQ